MTTEANAPPLRRFSKLAVGSLGVSMLAVFGFVMGVAALFVTPIAWFAPIGWLGSLLLCLTALATGLAAVIHIGIYREERKGIPLAAAGLFFSFILFAFFVTLTTRLAVLFVYFQTATS